MFLRAYVTIAGFSPPPNTLSNDAANGCLVSFSDSAVLLAPAEALYPLLRVPQFTDRYVVNENYIPADDTTIPYLKTLTDPATAGFSVGGGELYIGLEKLSYDFADAGGLYNAQRAQGGTQFAPVPAGSGKLRTEPALWWGRGIQVHVWAEELDKFTVLHDGRISGSPQMTPDGLIEIQFGDLLSGLDRIPSYEPEDIRLTPGVHVFTAGQGHTLPSFTVTLKTDRPSGAWGTFTAGGTATIGGVDFRMMIIDSINGEDESFYRHFFSLFYLTPGGDFALRAGTTLGHTRLNISNDWVLPVQPSFAVWSSGPQITLYFKDIGPSTFPSPLLPYVSGHYRRRLTPELQTFGQPISLEAALNLWAASLPPPGGNVYDPGVPVSVAVSSTGVQVSGVSGLLPLDSVEFHPPTLSHHFVRDYDPVAAEFLPPGIWAVTWSLAEAWYTQGESMICLDGDVRPGATYTIWPAEEEDDAPTPNSYVTVTTEISPGVWGLSNSVADSWGEWPLEPSPVVWRRSARASASAGRVAAQILASVAGESSAPRDDLPHGLGLKTDQINFESFETFYDPAGVRSGFIFYGSSPTEVMGGLVSSLNARLVQWASPTGEGHQVHMVPSQGVPPLAFDPADKNPLIGEFAIDAMPHRTTAEAEIGALSYETDDELTIKYRDLEATQAGGGGESVKLYGVRGDRGPQQVPLWLGQAASRIAAEGWPSVAVAFSCAMDVGRKILGVGHPFRFQVPAGLFLPGADGQPIPAGTILRGVCERITQDALNWLSYVEARLYFTLASGWAPAFRLASDDLNGVTFAQDFGPLEEHFFRPGDAVDICPRGDRDSIISRLISTFDLGTNTVVFSGPLPSSFNGATVRHATIIRPETAGFAWFAEDWYYL